MHQARRNDRCRHLEHTFILYLCLVHYIRVTRHHLSLFGIRNEHAETSPAPCYLGLLITLNDYPVLAMKHAAGCYKRWRVHSYFFFLSGNNVQPPTLHISLNDCKWDIAFLVRAAFEPQRADWR